MAVRKISAKKQKIRKQFSRRLHSGWVACPTDSFWSFKDYARNEIDKKETSKTLKAYIRDNYKGEERKILLSALEWYYTYPYFVSATIEWKKLGHEFPPEWDCDTVIQNYMTKLKKAGLRAIQIEQHKPTEEVQKRSPADIVKERTSDFIGEVENVLDIFFNGVWLDVEEYSVYNELQKIDAPYNIAKGVYDYYLPIKEEAELIAKVKPPKDLAEAYDHWDYNRRQDYLKLLTVIINDAEKYMIGKKATRKISKPKVKSADKQITKLNYLKSSNEFKVTSIDPIKIIGAQRLYTFNAKTRMLTEYTCKSAKGFEVKGSTLQHMDELTSRQTRLRKPEEFLTIVLSKTPKAIDTEWKKLTTKTNVPTPRINKDTIILRSLDK
jgi:hypothetical protein